MTPMMLRKLFNKKEESQPNNKEIDLTTNPSELPFELLVLTYLENNGINKSGNNTGKKVELTAEDIESIELTLKALGFHKTEFLEQLVLEEWAKQKELNNDLIPFAFAREFVMNYHNTKIEKFAPQYVIDRNRKISEAYSKIIITIEKIQGLLNDEGLRTRIESNLIKQKFTKSTISQCTTPFCVISLGCDEMGRFNIIYSVDYRFQEMISEDFASTFIRRIYYFTSGEMEPFVRIGSLYADCTQYYNQLIEESKKEDYHKIVKKE